MKRIARSALLSCAVIFPASVMPIGGVAYAQTANRNYSIAAQDLGDALRQFATQSGRDVVFDPALTAGKSSRAVQGSIETTAALRQLIDGSGLTFTSTSNGFALRSVEKNGVAVADRAAGTADSAGDGSEGISEILVVGSRSQNVDIKRTEDDPQPYVVFDSKQIEQSGATNVEEFLRKRLTMNTQQRAQSQLENNTGGEGANNNSNINLRGLGVQQTLILIDGRRAPRVLGGGQTGFRQADLNGLPVSAIERIEVLPSTAGGIYGGGATGGVINVIRKRNYDGVTARLNLDGTFSGGGEAFRLEINGGFSPDHGTTQISFSASRAHTRPLRVKDNELWKHSRNLYLANEDEYLAAAGPNAISPFRGYTTNILSATNGGCQCHPILTLDPEFGGGSLGSDRTHVPIGYAGFNRAISTSMQPFVVLAGTYNTGLADDYLGRHGQLTIGTRVTSANFNIRRRFNNWLDTFLDLSFSENVSRNKFLVLSSPTFTLQASDQNNPFQQAIVVSIPQIGIESEQYYRGRQLLANAGAIVQLAPNWKASLEYNWTRQRSITEYPGFSNFNAAMAGAAVRSGILNPFVDANTVALDFNQFTLSEPDGFTGPLVTKQQIFSGRVAGTLFKLPGGNLSLTALLERRLDEAEKSTTRTVTTETASPPRSQSVNSAYIELRAPIVSASNRLPFVREFELQASLRHDRYRTEATDPTFYCVNPSPLCPIAPPANFGLDISRVRNTSFTLAGRWSPLRDLAFRASYATGFLPPSIHQIVSTDTVTTTVGGPDPKRGNQPIPAGLILRSGGNNDLEAETSRSLSFGMVVEPHFIPGLRLSADYTSIRKRGEIGSPPVSIASEDQFPGRIIRDPLTPGDQALGYTGGVVRVIDRTLINLANSKVQAWDFGADYSIETEVGRLNPFVMVTLQTKFERQTLPTSEPFDSVGYSGGPLKWRLNSGLNWERGPWSLDWAMQYYHRYDVGSPLSSAAIAPSNALVYVRQGSRYIPYQVYHDIAVRYRLGSSSSVILRGLELTATIFNVFDKRPPTIVPSDASVFQTYSGYGDPRLRRFSFGLKKRF